MSDEPDVPSDFLDSGSLDSAIRQLGGDLIGQQIGVYQITALLGAGGMGEVYRARDTRLGRDVAIKVLLPELTADADRLARFQREAKVLASLNHPNIGAIYGFEEGPTDGGRDVHALVLELVEGETLAETLGGARRQGVKVGEALRIARQIAEALEAAHEKGIIHRDLKPANIKITPEGRVKVLDFGLAKLAQRTPGVGLQASDVPDLAAVTMNHTERGMILGTAAYMSPEQARGQALDKRTDIWAFGCVLYEMLTGTASFAGPTISDTIASILEREPDWSRLPSSTPAVARRLLKRCLQKDPTRRLRDIGDARLDLEEVGSHDELSPANTSWVSRRSIALSAAVAAMLIVAAIAYVRFPRGSVSELPAAVVTPSSIPLTTYPGLEHCPSLSPDGGQVAFAWNGERQDNWDIYVKVVGLATAPLRLTSHRDADLFPAWSPDGRTIAFAREKEILLMSPLGGAERKLADFEVSGPISWSPDGKSLVASRPMTREEPGGVFLIPVEAGEIRQLTAGGARLDYASPTLSPNGKHLAFGACTWVGFRGSFRQGIRSTTNCEIRVWDVDDDPLTVENSRRLTRPGLYLSGLAWTPDSQSVVYSAALGLGSGHYLWQVSASGSTDPRQLAIAPQALWPAVARTGDRLVHSRVESDFDVWLLEAAGGPRKHLSSTRNEMNAMFSPDGARVAFASSRSGKGEIWVANADGSQPLQLTSSPEDVGTPRWSPDGRSIAYDMLVNGARDIFVIDASGGKPRRVVEHRAQDRVPSWSRDGKFIYFASTRNAGKDQVFRVAVSGGQAVQMTDAGGYVAFESMDGVTLYYTKDGLGSSPLFARAVSGGAERQVLESVYNRAFTVSRDGIYYIAMAADDGRFPLRFLDFSIGQSRLISTLDGPIALGLSVSNDGRQVLYSVISELNADLVLAENFR